MVELGVQLICANSPQAKGRVERANGILQNRLVKELRLRDISTIENANAFLPEFIHRYNAKFAKEPKCTLDLHRPAPDFFELDRILTHNEQRRVSKNLTIQFGSDHFEILLPAQARRLAHTLVNVRRMHNGRIVVERKGQELPIRLLAKKTSRPNIVDAKAIALIPIASPSRQSSPEKAHKPAPTHPWRTYARRLPKGDTSTEFAGDITA
jgi:hypothetical protein